MTKDNLRIPEEEAVKGPYGLSYLLEEQGYFHMTGYGGPCTETLYSISASMPPS